VDLYLLTPFPIAGIAMTEKYFIGMLLALGMVWMAVVWWIVAPYVGGTFP
jgi:hypothetical protein